MQTVPLSTSKKPLFAIATVLLFVIGTAAWFLIYRTPPEEEGTTNRSEKKERQEALMQSEHPNYSNSSRLFSRNNENDRSSETRIVIDNHVDAGTGPSHIERRNRKPPLPSEMAKGILVERIPGADPEDEPPMQFANRQDEIHFYQRLIEVDERKLEEYEKVIVEFQENKDLKNAQYYLDLLNTANRNLAEHQIELNKAIQKEEY